MSSALLFPLAIAVATAVALAATTLYLHYRLVRLTELLAQTARQVEVFSEASVAMGGAVGQWLRRVPLEDAERLAKGASARPSRGAGTSRRLLLQQAKAQLEEGVPVQEVAQYCGLSEDEVRLLSCLQPPGHSARA